jgi:hypothetical protein
VRQRDTEDVGELGGETPPVHPAVTGEIDGLVLLPRSLLVVSDSVIKKRIREGTAGRLKNPARSTCPRTSTLRISHFPDPHRRRYAEHATPEALAEAVLQPAP